MFHFEEFLRSEKLKEDHVNSQAMINEYMMNLNLMREKPFLFPPHDLDVIESKGSDEGAMSTVKKTLIGTGKITKNSLHRNLTDRTGGAGGSGGERTPSVREEEIKLPDRGSRAEGEELKAENSLEDMK